MVLKLMTIAHRTAVVRGSVKLEDTVWLNKHSATYPMSRLNGSCVREDEITA